MNEKNKTTYSLALFIGMTMALVANVRSIPTIAATGWQQISYLLFAIFCFAIPVCLIAGEFGSMFLGNGGPQLWVRKSLDDKWGFVVAWLLWSQMFPGLIMVTSTLGPLVAQTFGQASLISNHWFTLGCILTVIWVITLLSFKFDMAKIGGHYGVWIGVYIPVMILIVLGLLASIKIGLNPDSYLGLFSWDKVMPSLTNKETLTYLSAIMFLFTGIELTSVYIPELKNSSKNYTKGIFISLLFIVLLNIINSMFVSNAIPKGTIQLSNISQPIAIYCKILDWPVWIANIFSFLVVCGVIIQLTSWINGPCHTISQVAKEGYLPAKWGFHKTNDYDISKGLLWTQVIVLSIFALLYAFDKDVNVLFLTLTNATNVLYMIVYVIMAISLLVLRKKDPNRERPNRIGKKGNGLAWFICCLLIFSIILILLSILSTNNLEDILTIVGIVAVLFITPLLINHYHNPKWLDEINKDLGNK